MKTPAAEKRFSPALVIALLRQPSCIAALFPFFVRQQMVVAGTFDFVQLLSCPMLELGGRLCRPIFPWSYRFSLPIGAYTSTVLFRDYAVSPWIGMWAGAGLAALLGAVLSAVAFWYRVRGVFFSVITLKRGRGVSRAFFRL